MLNILCLIFVFTFDAQVVPTKTYSTVPSTLIVAQVVTISWNTLCSKFVTQTANDTFPTSPICNWSYSQRDLLATVPRNGLHSQLCLYAIGPIFNWPYSQLVPFATAEHKICTNLRSATV